MIYTTVARRGLAVGLALAILAGCAPQQPADQGGALPPTAIPAPPTALPPTVAPPTALPPTVAPPTVAPPTAVPPVVVAPPTDPANPQRISFAPGATSGAVEGAVIRGTRDYYVLGAAAGQWMTVTLTSLEQNGAVVITDPTGAPLPGAEPGADASSWAGTLPASGDYRVEVGPTRGNATYRLEVSIISALPDPASAIRSANWPAVFADDPALTVEQINGQTYVSIRAAQPTFGGIPQLDAIVYGDFNGDGREEAAIALHSGGTAGNIGLLVYGEGARRPALAGWLEGYKLYPFVEDGRLMVREPVYADGDPNCCPSSFRTTVYVLGPGGLEAVETR